MKYIGKQAFQLTESSLGASWVENHLGDKPYKPKDFMHRTVYMGPALTEIGAKAFDGWESGWDGVFTIQGYDGTYAEKWAKENRYPFESLGAAPAPELKPGDVDGDGNISAADARLALRRSVGLETYEEGSPAFLACDVDLDGNVSAADARLILRASVGLEDPKTWVK